jgi:hypothetical protein
VAVEPRCDVVHFAVSGEPTRLATAVAVNFVARKDALRVASRQSETLEQVVLHCSPLSTADHKAKAEKRKQRKCRNNNNNKKKKKKKSTAVNEATRCNSASSAPPNCFSFYKTYFESRSARLRVCPPVMHRRTKSGGGEDKAPFVTRPRTNTVALALSPGKAAPAIPSPTVRTREAV